MADYIVPVIQRMHFPTAIDLSSGTAAFEIGVEATDNLSGVTDVVVWFDEKISYAFRPDGSSFNSYRLFIVGGEKDDWSDGEHSRTFGISDVNNPGVYSIDRVTVSDGSGNERTYSPSELQALGVDTTIRLERRAEALEDIPGLAPFVARQDANGISVVSTDTIAAGTSLRAHIDFAAETSGSFDWTMGPRGGSAGQLSQSSTMGQASVSGELALAPTTDVASGETVLRLNASAPISSLSVTTFDMSVDDRRESVDGPASDLIVSDGGALKAGSSDDDSLIGFDPAETLRGRGGNDLLYGQNGSDTIFGHSGDDRMSGGNGADLLKGGKGSDLLRGGRGDDELHGSGWSDRLFGEGGGDALYGGYGSDSLDGGKGDDQLRGGPGNDIMNGGNRHDDLRGGRGGDELYGGGGRDTLNGGGDNDLLDGGRGADRLVGMFGNDTLTGGAWSDTLAGGAGHDSLAGQRGSDLVFGGGGADFQLGQAGTDTLVGNGGADTMRGGIGDDAIRGGFGNDVLFGGSGKDLMIGSNGADRLRGGTWSDTLEGGGGPDELAGGRGPDSFVFTGRFGQDSVVDFSPSEDMIHIDEVESLDAFKAASSDDGKGNLVYNLHDDVQNVIVFKGVAEADLLQENLVIL